MEPESVEVEPELGELVAHTGGGGESSTGDLRLVHDVPLEVAVEIGRTKMTVGEALAIVPGSVIMLQRQAGEPVDLLVNGRRVARGEVVAVDEEFGLRVTEVLGPRGGGGGE